MDAVAARVLAGGLAALAGAAALFLVYGAPHRALLFGVTAAPVWLVAAGTFARQRAAESARGAVGMATALTLVRGWLVSALAGFVAQPPAAAGVVSWVPAVLYTAAALGDLVDGYVARRRGEVSLLGARLDGAMDALGLLVGSAVAIALGRLPVWYLLLGGAFYLFHFGVWLRGRRGLPVHGDRLRPSRHARSFAGLQMGLVATALYPVLGPPATALAATLFMLPSLALFARDWLVVTGRLDPDGPRHLGLVARTEAAVFGLLPLPLRAAAAAGLGALFAAAEPAAAPALELVLLAPALLIALGLLTRLAALGAAVPLALLVGRAPSAPAWIAFAATAALILFGGGRAALWTPEDRLILRRAGERQAGVSEVPGPSQSSGGDAG